MSGAPFAPTSANIIELKPSYEHTTYEGLRARPIPRPCFATTLTASVARASDPASASPLRLRRRAAPRQARSVRPCRQKPLPFQSFSNRVDPRQRASDSTRAAVLRKRAKSDRQLHNYPSVASRIAGLLAASIAAIHAAFRSWRGPTRRALAALFASPLRRAQARERLANGCERK